MFGLFKQKEINIINKEELIETLTRIVELLLDNGYPYQADVVKKPLEYLHSNDKENFLKCFLTLDIWGGSGAAWEVGRFKSREVEIEFETYFIKLAELMNQTGIKNGKAQSVAKFFKNDIKK